jgi:hypothetical protein
LAYVASLEDRLRDYEQRGIQANISLQKLSKRLDVENRRLKCAITECCGMGENDIDRAVEADLLAKEMKARLSGNFPSPKSSTGGRGGPGGYSLGVGRSSSFSGGITDTILPPRSLATAYSVGYHPLSDIRSERMPITPPTSEDPQQQLLLTLAPTGVNDCGDNLTPEGKRFCGLLKLLAVETGGPAVSKPTIPCRLSYDLLMSLVDEKDSLAVENLAFVLKDGVSVFHDGGCAVDAKVLASVVETLSVQQHEIWTDQNMKSGCEG